MAERRENSVLFSLKELRRIEDSRLEEEKAAERARVESEVRAKEDAERRARADEDRRRREEEDRLRAIEDAKHAKVREDQLRLQEAERRARVEGELRLKEEQMRLEVQARAGKSPIKAVLGVAFLLVAVAGGLGFKMYSDHQAELKQAEIEKARLAEENKRIQAELETKMASIQKEMDDKLKNANTEEEKAKIREEAAKARAAAATAANQTRKHPRSSGSKSDKATASAKQDKPSDLPTTIIKAPVKKKSLNDDPLGGLNL